MSIKLETTPEWKKQLDEAPRSLVASRFSAHLADIDSAHWHAHRKGQLLYCAKGVLTCEVAGATWIVPAQTAVWIPAALPHRAFGTGDVECCSLLVEQTAHPQLPTTCCTVSLSRLLRELILAAVDIPVLHDVGGRDGHLVSLLLEELARAKPENFALPMPSDARLLRLVTHLLESPGDATSQTEWASTLGISERSFRRLFTEQCGMNFSRWRHQLHVILTIRRMTAGDNVQAISIDLGYENASSFVTMFKKIMGKPPARFLADHHHPIED